MTTPHAAPIFTGQYEAKLSGRGRFFLPAALREKFAAGAGGESALMFLFVDCLRLIPANTIRSAMEQIGGWQYEYERRMLASGSESMWGRNGWIEMPKRIMSMAGLRLGDEIMLVGCGKWVEVWKREDWLIEADQRKLPDGAVEHVRELLDE